MKNIWEQIKKIRKDKKRTKNPNIDLKPEIKTALKEEAKKKSKPKPKEIDRHAVISFVRMNPISKGHVGHVNFVKNLAIEHGADPMIFLSPSEGDHRNPLSYKDKFKYARKAFGSVIQKHNHKNILDVLKHLNKSYNHMNVVVGDDKHEEYGKLLQHFNGKHFNYEKLKVHTSGARSAGLSSHHMKNAASTDKFDLFHQSIPDKLKPHSQDIYNKVKLHFQTKM